MSRLVVSKGSISIFQEHCYSRFEKAVFDQMDFFLSVKCPVESVFHRTNKVKFMFYDRTRKI